MRRVWLRVVVLGCAWAGLSPILSVAQGGHIGFWWGQRLRLGGTCMCIAAQVNTHTLSLTFTRLFFPMINVMKTTIHMVNVLNFHRSNILPQNEML